MNRRGLAISIGFAVLLSEAAPVLADVYRCVGRDGRPIFTDDESRCAGAAKHESTGAIQTHSSAAPPSAVADSPGAAGRPKISNPGGETSMKKHWRARKRALEDELRALQGRREYLSRFVTGCNRGAEVTTRDETGIKRTVSCDEIRAEYTQTLERLESTREYLDSGLRRECRQAGCLPGWIR